MSILIIILILLAIILALSGIVGSIVPALPGPPLTLGGLLVAYFITPEVTMTVVITMTILTIIAQVIDYLAPIWLTKMGGGSRAAIWGSTLGTIAGLFFMPVGLIVGPLIGAFLGEMSSSHELGKAVRVALMSFVAFLLTTGFKLVLSLMMCYYTLLAFFHLVRHTQFSLC